MMNSDTRGSQRTQYEWSWKDVVACCLVAALLGGMGWGYFSRTEPIDDQTPAAMQLEIRKQPEKAIGDVSTDTIGQAKEPVGATRMSRVDFLAQVLRPGGVREETERTIAQAREKIACLRTQGSGYLQDQVKLLSLASRTDR